MSRKLLDIDWSWLNFMSDTKVKAIKAKTNNQDIKLNSSAQQR